MACCDDLTNWLFNSAARWASTAALGSFGASLIACLLALDSATSYCRGFKSFTFLFPIAPSAASLAPLSNSRAEIGDLANTFKPVAMNRARTSLWIAALAASSIARSVASSPCSSSMRLSVSPSITELGRSASMSCFTISRPEEKPPSISDKTCGSIPVLPLVIF